MVGVMRTTKRCPHCQRTLPLAEFIRPRAGTPSDYCHPCRQEKRRREYQRAGGSSVSYAKNLARHGLSVDQYDAMVDAQNGRCAACHEPETVQVSGGTRRLSVDFDAASGRVRGLLCSRCIVIVGALPAVREAVARYLGEARYQTVTTTGTSRDQTVTRLRGRP
jgi:hypothetical protein